MKPVWKLGRLAGVDLYLHLTFPILLAWLVIHGFSRAAEPNDALAGAVTALALFAAVLVHELTHFALARRFGIRTREITFLPVGGLSQVDRGKRFSEEVLIAVAGPTVNVALALLYFALPFGRSELPFPAFVATESTSFPDQFARANVVLAAFNLLPAFPLDGGRVLRALMTLRMKPTAATRLALAIAKSIAIILGLAGLASDPILVLFAVSLWAAGASESSAADVEDALSGVHVDQVMVCDCQTFRSDESLARVANHLLASAQEDFPIVDQDGHFVGLLRRRELSKGIAEFGQLGSVRDILPKQRLTARPEETVIHLLRRWPAGETALAVVREGRPVGLFTLANLGEFLLLHSALTKHDQTGTPAPSAPSSLSS